MSFVFLNNFGMTEVSTVCSEWSLQLLDYVYDVYKGTKESE